MNKADINTWAYRAARAAFDSGQPEIEPLDALEFVLNAARENDEVVTMAFPLTSRVLRPFKHAYRRHLGVLKLKATATTPAGGLKVYHASIEELGGETWTVVASTPEKARSEMLRVWREYDQRRGSDYRGQVKTFADLHDIYGACVVELTLGEAVAIQYLEPLPDDDPKFDAPSESNDEVPEGQ